MALMFTLCRLEIWHNLNWGTVCSDWFHRVNADVACRLLGYEAGMLLPPDLAAPYLLSVNGSGAGAVAGAAPVNHTVRLLMACNLRQVALLAPCCDCVTVNPAKPALNPQVITPFRTSLGLLPQASSVPPIQLDNLDCLGDESSLAACRRNAWGFHDCDHSQDVALRCYRYPEGERGRLEMLRVLLVGQNYQMRGRARCQVPKDLHVRFLC